MGHASTTATAGEAQGSKTRGQLKGDRILSPLKYSLLPAHCPAHLTPMVKVAYDTALRHGQILTLSWGRLRMKGGFILLSPGPGKTDEGRRVPLAGSPAPMFKAMPQGLPGVQGFTRNEDPIKSIGEVFEAAGRKAGIDPSTFHDLMPSCNQPGGTGVSPVPAQAKASWPFWVTPNYEIPCRGGSRTAPTGGLSR
jgi:integrase